MIRKLTLYVHTIRYLTGIQIWSQLTLLMKKRLFKRFIIRYTKSKNVSSWNRQIQLIKKPVHAQKPDYKNGIFIFINETHQFSSGIEWNSPELSKLWLYNLHYFDFLIPSCDNPSDKSFQEIKSILNQWIDDNPIGTGNGWEPYPSSLRIVNWIYFYSFYQKYFKIDHLFENKFVQSLYYQSIYLQFFFETHLLANHLFANIKALFWSGCFFNKSRWVTKAKRLLISQMKEQILNDGGHFERSPMYHTTILMDVLDALGLLNSEKNNRRLEVDSELNKLLKKTALSMITWLKWLTHPDGRIALFGDSALSIMPCLKEVCDYSQKVGILFSTESAKSENVDHTRLVDSGYDIFQSRNIYLVVDSGELGVSYQPGHAHCDLANYEFSFRGERMIVDSGVGEYLNTPLRKYTRSCKAHNTVCVEGLDQAELWSTFRMGRRIGKITSSVLKRDQDYILEVSYANDLQKKHPYFHRRKFKIFKSGFFVHDMVTGVNTFNSYIHIHPNCTLNVDANEIVVTKNDRNIIIHYQSSNTEMIIAEHVYTPEFGEQITMQTLVFTPKQNNNIVKYIISSERNFDWGNICNVFPNNV